MQVAVHPFRGSLDLTGMVEIKKTLSFYITLEQVPE